MGAIGAGMANLVPHSSRALSVYRALFPGDGLNDNARDE